MVGNVELGGGAGVNHLVLTARLNLDDGAVAEGLGLAVVVDVALFVGHDDDGQGIDEVLDNLVHLTESHKHNHGNRHNSPLPGKVAMDEDVGGDGLDVQNDDEGDESEDNGSRQPVVIEPLDEEDRGTLGTDVVGMDHETHVENREGSGTGGPDNVAVGSRVAVAVVTAVSEAVVDAIGNEHEGHKGAGSKEQAVEEGIGDKLLGEEAVTVGANVENGLLGLVKGETSSWGRAGEHVKPEDFDGGQNEDGTTLVLDGESKDQNDDLGDVSGQQMDNELTDGLSNTTALSDGLDDGGEVIVGDDDVGNTLGNIRTGSHGATNIGDLDGGGVVETISGHGDDATTAMNGLNHLDLRLGGAAANNEWEIWEGI